MEEAGVTNFEGGKANKDACGKEAEGDDEPDDAPY